MFIEKFLSTELIFGGRFANICDSTNILFTTHQLVSLQSTLAKASHVLG